MTSLKNIISIARKEVQSYLNNPSSYIVAVLFLLLWQFLFYRSAFLINEVSLRSLYGVFPWLMLILVPALTMGAITKEKDEGTLELTLTHPVSELDYILGKFFGSFLFTSVVLVFVIPIAILFSSYGNFDWGVFAGQFIGSLLFAASFIALGIFTSGLVGNQVAALLLSAVLGFVFIISGAEFFTISLPLEVASIFERLSIVSHMESISRGVLDLRDIWYFLSFIAVFLSLAYLQLLKSKYGSKKSMYIKFQTATVLFIGIAVLTNVIGNRIPGRVDLTQQRIYTLSQATKDTVSDLDDIVTIDIFVSDKLPAQYSPVLRETKDLIRDYKNASRGNIVVNTKNPVEDEDVAAEARSIGIREIQFNVIGQDDFQIKTGFLGLAVSYGGQSEVIPFIQQTSDLEYQLTSILKKLTVTDKKQIGFIDGIGDKSLSTHYTNLREAVSTQFDVTPILVESPTEPDEEITPPVIDPSMSTIIVAGPNNPNTSLIEPQLAEFISNGGSVLFMLDSYEADTQMQTIAKNQDTFGSFISNYGVTLDDNAVYDLRFNQTLRVSDGVFSYLLPYPFWVRAVPADNESTITMKLDTVVLPWASSLSINEEVLQSMGFSYSEILITSENAGVQSGTVMMDPQQNFSSANLAERTMAYSLVNENNGARLLIIGDSDFLTDDYTSTDPQSLAFGMNALSWLTQEASLGAIRIKDRTAPSFTFESENDSTRIKVISMGIAFIVPSLYAFYRLASRRNLSRRSYSK